MLKSGHLPRVVLTGNPNSGKTSLFNALTGSRLHVGNYPGVTVERREGRWRLENQDVRLEDLPGTYGLDPWSPEERVARRELLDNRPDAAIVVVDSSSPERGISFFLQVQLAGIPCLLCLNMADEALAAGQVLDVPTLSRELQAPVVETVAHTGQGLPELARRVLEMLAVRECPDANVFSGGLAEAIGIVSARVQQERPDLSGPQFIASQLLAGTVSAASLLPTGAPDVLQETVAQQLTRIESGTADDVAVQLAQAFFTRARHAVAISLRARARADARARSDRVDRVLANRLLGLPIFLLLMFGLFWATFTLGDYPVSWLESGFALLSDAVVAAWPEGQAPWLQSLVVDGLIGGVGGVLVFVPNIVLLFLGLALLEDTGYMARGAFIMDRFMRRFGLHGKSFIPMICGFGCSIPGIMGTRILEDERDRLLTMFVLPLMSCGARLPIWLLLVPAFFPPAWRAPVLWVIYFFGVLVALLLALVLRRTVFRGAEAPFVMELPPYRMPTLKALVRKMWERSWLYVRKAGTVILAISVVMWLMTSYPKPDRFVVDTEIAAGLEISPEAAEHRRQAEALRYSVAGQVGTIIEPVIAPLGFDWRLGVAMVGAFAAKEVFVSQMAIVYSLGGDEEAGSASLSEYIRRDYSPAAGISLILFLLIATPCMATVAVTRREAASWRFALLQFFGLTGLGYLVALAGYHLVGLFLLIS